MLSHYLYYLEMLPADGSHQTMYLIDNHTVKEQKILLCHVFYQLKWC